MNLSAALYDNILVIGLAGDVDAMTAPELTLFLEKQMADTSKQVVIDCQHIQYVGSAGIRVFLAALKIARQGGGDIRLAAIPPDAQKVFEMTGIVGIMKIYNDVASAVASFV